MNPKVYILLPVHNRRSITERFIKCLQSQTYQNYHLILIDDGSTDETAEMVREKIKNLTVIRGNGSWWWAGSLQEGYEWLLSNHISLDEIALIANDDTEFDPNFLDQAVQILMASPHTLLQAQCYSRDQGRLITAGVKVDWKKLSFSPSENIDEINCLSTRGLFLKIKDFIKIGGFYPRLLPHYLSDYEFTIRAQRQGMNLITDSTLKLCLDEQSTGYHQYDNQSFSVFIKQIFSLKSAGNPIIFTRFVFLCCPNRYKLSCYCLVWMRFFLTLLSVISKFRHWSKTKTNHIGL
ncbi:glycosyltransferase [Laspinema sp. A4]|uniref:glycosyltransferase family 2 protein n=1 Tax=Laspinema sp. D2d TaxID=2953686 RepID=UPI0021BAFEA4|nr:glycosyltransferase [Laspinema sp. D2d]MCT7983611.1 glycosyltransferase [Laspinema sp. D2d]